MLRSSPQSFGERKEEKTDHLIIVASCRIARTLVTDHVCPPRVTSCQRFQVFAKDHVEINNFEGSCMNARFS
jgi:hypothetical protein